jgi:hypothetical protein
MDEKLDEIPVVRIVHEHVHRIVVDGPIHVIVEPFRNRTFIGIRWSAPQQIPEGETNG